MWKKKVTMNFTMVRTYVFCISKGSAIETSVLATQLLCTYCGHAVAGQFMGAGWWLRSREAYIGVPCISSTVAFSSVYVVVISLAQSYHQW